jgi:predicted RNase H-like HicB family nuclease
LNNRRQETAGGMLGKNNDNVNPIYMEKRRQNSIMAGYYRAIFPHLSDYSAIMRRFKRRYSST